MSENVRVLTDENWETDLMRAAGPVLVDGITCAVVPSRLPGIDIGRRHDPMGIAFPNGPNEGHDVLPEWEIRIESE